jgi:hypothetical protein
MILSVFLHRRGGKTDRHDKKNESGNFKPELMQYTPKSACRAADRAHDGVKRAAPARLIARNPHHDARLVPSRNFAHGLDFNSLRRYNDANARWR